MRNENIINYALLLLRVGLGIAFILHGYPVLTNHEGFATALTAAGIPGGEISAILAGISEVVCGVLLIVGFLHRLASFGLILTMAMAIYFHMSLGGSFAPGPHSYSHALEILIVLVSMFMAGAGTISVDNKLFKK